MRVAVIGLRNPIPRLNMMFVSCVLLHVVLLLLVKCFIMDNSCHGEFIMPDLQSQIFWPVRAGPLAPRASVSPRMSIFRCCEMTPVCILCI